MKKEFLSPECIRDNAFLLAEKMYLSGVIPTIMYVSLRGGAIFGNAISEYFKLALPVERKPLYAVVVTHSYDTFERNMVHIDGWTFPPSYIRPTDCVMLVDDIFDSGKTINALAQEILSHNVSRKHLKIVVHDYKICHSQQAQHMVTPDYYSRKLHVEHSEESAWIHYLSHELDGLTEEEVRSHYSQAVQETIIRLIRRREA